MTFIAIVTYTFTPYMGETSGEKTKPHTVDAVSEYEAEKKIYDYYNNVKSDMHGDSYTIVGIEFFEHIK
jgi:hypothetical protein